jgi:hypothetical protein
MWGEKFKRKKNYLIQIKTPMMKIIMTAATARGIIISTEK